MINAQRALPGEMYTLTEHEENVRRIGNQRHPSVSEIAEAVLCGAVTAIREQAQQFDMNVWWDNPARPNGDAERGNVFLFFPGKPSQTIRDACKREGFRWAPTVGAWSRHYSSGAVYAAGRIKDLWLAKINDQGGSG